MSETRGRKPKYETPASLRFMVEKYFDECNESRTFPDYAGMKLYLKVSESTLKKYTDENHADYMGFRAVMEYAKDRRESWLVRKMTTDNKAAQGCLNALKQPINGGYVDKPVDNGEKTLNINVTGIGGFKSFK